MLSAHMRKTPQTWGSSVEIRRQIETVAGPAQEQIAPEFNIT